MNELKNLLKKFNINTGKIVIGKGNIRRNGIVTKELTFRIITKDNILFYNEIGWLK